MQMLFSFKWEHLEEAIRIIPCDAEHGEWVLKKAGLMSMLGLYKETVTLLRDGIYSVRRILIRTESDNIKIYNRFSSLESSMIALLKYVKQAYEFWDGKSCGCSR